MTAKVIFMLTVLIVSLVIRIPGLRFASSDCCVVCNGVQWLYANVGHRYGFVLRFGKYQPFGCHIFLSGW